MSDEAKLDRILDDWARSGVPLEDAAASESRRERIVPRIAENIRRHAEESARRRRVRRFTFALAAAAAVALLIGVFATREEGERVATGSAAPAALPTLAVGSEAHTERDARRALQIGPATLELAPSSRVSLLEAVGESRLVRLDAGEIQVQVAKLAAPATFAVVTPDARVVVHGTRFVVKLLGPEQPSPRTRVHVSEGVVSVIYAGTESFVSAGASWPGPAPTPAATQASEPPPPVKAAPRSEPASVPTSVALAEQNRMFSSAVAARRRGDDRAALAELDRLLRKYPNGPLAPEARVERFRALKRLGQSEAAAREAKKYLLENKDGFARDEARELVLPPKEQ